MSWKDGQPGFQNDKGRSSGTEKDSGQSVRVRGADAGGEELETPETESSHGNQAPGGAPHRERRGAGGFGLPARDEGLSAPVWKAHRTDGTDLNETSGDTLLRDRRARHPGRRPDQRPSGGGRGAEALPKHRKTGSPPTVCYPA